KARHEQTPEPLAVRRDLAAVAPETRDRAGHESDGRRRVRELRAAEHVLERREREDRPPAGERVHHLRREARAGEEGDLRRGHRTAPSNAAMTSSTIARNSLG